MTQTTDHGTFSAPAPVLVQGRRKAALVACFARGATTAGLGLGAVAVLVMVLWISSPYPDSGPQGALHVAAGIWLLAHGTELIRTDTLTGPPAPMGLVPLLLVVLPVWLVHRAARDALLPANGRPRPSAGGAICAVSAGYLLVGAAATVYAARGPLIADTHSALLHLPLVTVLAAAAGAWTASGRPDGTLPTWLPTSWRLTLARTRVITVLRAAVAGALALFGGGALLVAAALVWHADATQDTFLHLASVWSGRLAVLLLGLVLVPNAAIWAAAYGLGPGFALGTGATATPLFVTADPALPPFPLLAAVPAEGPGTPWNWACAGVPLVAALVIVWFVVTAAAPRGAPREAVWGNRETALTALCAAVGCGLSTAAMAAASGGSLGTGRMTHFGPVWWQSGGAALLWSAVIAVPVSVLLRMWRVRGRQDGPTAEASGPQPSTAQRSPRIDAAGTADTSAPYDFLPTESWQERDGTAAQFTVSTTSSAGGGPSALVVPPAPVQLNAGDVPTAESGVDGPEDERPAPEGPSPVDWTKRAPEIGTAWTAPRPGSGAEPGCTTPAEARSDSIDVHSKEAVPTAEPTSPGEAPTDSGDESGASHDVAAGPEISPRKPWAAPPSPWPNSPWPNSPGTGSSGTGSPGTSSSRTGSSGPGDEASTGGQRKSTPGACEDRLSESARTVSQDPGPSEAPEPEDADGAAPTQPDSPSG
ncbi:DUF6350 family protein [Streptomyces sp. NPDC005963]|uniref:cell division protein PerM n=1 Tax=Streptomyces sp. NPDC005963 TaxID=3156721 RepID=UPI0034077986